jgi:hypothetical protein
MTKKQVAATEAPLTEEQPIAAGPPVASLRALLVADQEKRARAAFARIQPILTELRCLLAAAPRLAPDGADGWRIVCDVQIMAQE